MKQSYNIYLAQKIYNNSILLKKQLEVATDNQQTPPEVKGCLNAIRFGIIEVFKDADELVKECNKIDGNHEREVKRLKDKIANLENEPKTP